MIGGVEKKRKEGGGGKRSEREERESINIKGEQREMRRRIGIEKKRGSYA